MPRVGFSKKNELIELALAMTAEVKKNIAYRQRDCFCANFYLLHYDYYGLLY